MIVDDPNFTYTKILILLAGAVILVTVFQLLGWIPMLG